MRSVPGAVATGSVRMLILKAHPVATAPGTDLIQAESKQIMADYKNEL